MGGLVDGRIWPECENDMSGHFGLKDLIVYNPLSFISLHSSPKFVHRFQSMDSFTHHLVSLVVCWKILAGKAGLSRYPQT